MASGGPQSVRSAACVWVGFLLLEREVWARGGWPEAGEGGRAWPLSALGSRGLGGRAARQLWKRVSRRKEPAEVAREAEQTGGEARGHCLRPQMSFQKEGLVNRVGGYRELGH